MYQIDNTTAANAQPASTAAGTAGWFTDGNPATGNPATIVPAEWLNAVMMEAINILKAAGINPTKNAFSQLATAIQSNQINYAADTGTANTYAVAYLLPITAATLFDGMILSFQAKTANTGASTFNPNGLGASPIVGAAHQPLQGGEIVASGKIELMWHKGLNSWVLLEQTGGANQVGPATQSQHAMQLGQAVGRLLNIQVFTTSGTYTPTPGTTSIEVEMVGGGGGSGGCAATSSTQASGSAGGSSGSYGRGRFTAGFGGGLAVTIGAGGGGGAAGANNGGSGGTTSLGSLMSCPGGSFTVGGAAVTPPIIMSAQSGTSGAPTGANVVAVPGQAGGNAFAMTTTSLQGGAGGSNPLGTGGWAATATGRTSPSGYGAGGGGAVALSSTAAQAGASGAPGIVIIREYA